MGILFNNPRKIKIEFKEQITRTQNLFGSIEELKSADLYLVERNPNGHCLCVCKPKDRGEYLVDIHNEDIKSIYVSPIPADPMAAAMAMMQAIINKDKPGCEYCDECEHIFPTESQQEILRRTGYSNIPDHMCSLSQKKIIHNGQHPRLPKPSDCPLKGGMI